MRLTMADFRFAKELLRKNGRASEKTQMPVAESAGKLRPVVAALEACEFMLRLGDSITTIGAATIER